eukprot:6146431-Pyramimonas_sp.AAC.1
MLPRADDVTGPRADVMGTTTDVTVTLVDVTGTRVDVLVTNTDVTGTRADNKTCFTGTNWKIESTYEPKIMLTDSPA